MMPQTELPYSTRVQQRHELNDCVRPCPVADLPQRPRTTPLPRVRIEGFRGRGRATSLPGEHPLAKRTVGCYASCRPFVASNNRSAGGCPVTEVGERLWYRRSPTAVIDSQQVLAPGTELGVASPSWSVKAELP
jgi:hypothetical protein